MRKLFIILLTMCFVLPLSACSKAEDNKIRLTEVTHSVFYAPLYVAMENGYFLEENLQIELSCGQGANNCMSQLISGDADIGLMGVEASIYVFNEGRQNYPIVFGGLTNCDGSFIMSREKEENFTLKNLQNKEILGGRKGGVPAMSLEYALKKEGVFNDVNFNTTVQFDMMVGAFVAGTADYCTVFEPTASMLEKEGSAYVVDNVAKYSGKMPFTAFMCENEYLNSQNSKIEKFMTAINKAMNYVKNNDGTTIANCIKNQFPDTDITLLASSIDRYKSIGAYRENAVIEKPDFDRLQEVIMQAGIMDKEADYSKIIDNTIAKKLA